MKQVLQSIKNGSTEVADIPVPKATKGQLLIETSHTLVSSGTERMLLEFGKAGWFKKAKQKPDKVRAVIEKIRTDGLVSTIDRVLSMLDQPLPLGYCNVGRVVDFGEGVVGFKRGDRVVSNGRHAEFVAVPVNLCARVPDSVSDEDAVFTVLGAIALQGVRLAQPTIGETVVVTGLGLVGLLTVQVLRANGCRVLGVDFNKERLNLAQNFGAEIFDLSKSENVVEFSRSYSRGRGVDAVIIATDTASDKPLHQAAEMCRKRGRIILTGVAGLKLLRDDFFQKELTFQVSASYGPGRYDPNYEQRGQDYPVGFVRWTEQRNFEAVLDMMDDKNLNVSPLISHRFPISDAVSAYERLIEGKPSLAMLLNYSLEKGLKVNKTVALRHISKEIFSEKKKVQVSFIGAGNYASSVLIPAFARTGVYLKTLVSTAGVSGFHYGRKYGFQETTTDPLRVFSDEDTDVVVVCTRHDSHAKYVLDAIKGGKNVFIEKPLCLTLKELKNIENVYKKSLSNISVRPLVMVGFNRRFSPLVQKIKQLIVDTHDPKSFVLTVNAGALPPDHWAQDREIGGGRIIGEACHFVDLLRFLSGCPITTWEVNGMLSLDQGTVSIQLGFADGSIGTIHYFTNGNKAFPKERLEVFSQGRVLQLNNFRQLKGFGWPGFSGMNLWRQNKGQRECAWAFIQSVTGKKESPIHIEEIFQVARISIELAKGLE